MLLARTEEKTTFFSISVGRCLEVRGQCVGNEAVLGEEGCGIYISLQEQLVRLTFSLATNWVGLPAHLLMTSIAEVSQILQRAEKERLMMHGRT
jgi:hypothetical protein